MARIFSCRTSVYGSPSDAFQRLPDAGLTHAELCGVGPDGIGNAANAAAGHGVTIATVGSSVKLSDPDSVALYLELLAACGAAGVRHIFTSVGADADADRSACYEQLQELTEHADLQGLVICMETHPPFARNAAEAAETMAQVAHSALRMNFDTANIYYYNHDVDGVAELRQVADQVETVHLKDTDGGFHSANFPVLGEGVVDFPSTFDICNDAGITGPFTLELEGPLTAGKSLDERHDAVKASMAYLKQIGVR